MICDSQFSVKKENSNQAIFYRPMSTPNTQRIKLRIYKHLVASYTQVHVQYFKKAYEVQLFVYTYSRHKKF